MRIALREPRTGRLRASIRGLLPAVLTALLVLLASFTVPLAVGQFVDPATAAGVVVNVLAQWVTYIVPIAIALWLAIRLDRGTLARFGLDVDRRWLVNFGVGVVISLVAVAVYIGYGAGRGHFTVYPERVTDFGDATLEFAVVGLVLVFYR